MFLVIMCSLGPPSKINMDSVRERSVRGEREKRMNERISVVFSFFFGVKCSRCG